MMTKKQIELRQKEIENDRLKTRIRELEYKIDEASEKHKWCRGCEHGIEIPTFVGPSYYVCALESKCENFKAKG